MFILLGTKVHNSRDLIMYSGKIRYGIKRWFNVR